MGKKKSKLIWIILGVIFALIAVLSFTDCFSTSYEVDYSEFYSLVDKSVNDGVITNEELADSNAKEISKLMLADNYFGDLRISEVYIDGYNVSFEVIAGSKAIIFETAFPRDAETIAWFTESFDRAGISCNWADPNAGSFWSSLLPIAGYLIVAISLSL